MGDKADLGAVPSAEELLVVKAATSRRGSLPPEVLLQIIEGTVLQPTHDGRLAQPQKNVRGKE